ncbi:MAG: hypothetical protein WC787_04830 [Patescibacteria group bacterium]|jgi:hypothetical protein
MTRPHERLGLRQPLGRRLPQGIVGWNLLVAGASIAFMVAYIFQVNLAASRAFTLRDVERKVDTLKTEVVALEDKTATLSSVQAMTDRAVQLGFVTVERLEFVNPASRSYALK